MGREFDDSDAFVRRPDRDSTSVDAEAGSSRADRGAAAAVEQGICAGRVGTPADEDAGNAAADDARTGRSRQVRYAVVLNGGVSLAVWMGGVTHELNRIRLASFARPGPVHAGGDLGPWQAILRKANRTAVVDLIAGTSAGGLNGTVLATSVARGADMPDMKEVWSNAAELRAHHLIRECPDGATSLLDGTYFEEQINEIMSGMTNAVRDPQQCTLLVTATGLDSTVLRTPLETGSEMSTRDGRRVYQFDYRPMQKPVGATRTSIGVNHFDLDGNAGHKGALVLAARASASFPVAFAPVFETDDLRARRVVPADDRVATSWLVDGGVLDNAPIEPLIAVLRQTATDQPYERVMLYITPGVGLPAGAVSSAAGDPSIKQTMTSVLSAMREPDERLDMDSLRLIFDEMSLTRTQAHDVLTSFLADPTIDRLRRLKQAAGLLFEHYRAARAEAFERWLQSKSGESQTSPLIPPEEPTLEPDDVPGMPLPAPDGDPPAAITNDCWNWGAAAADRCVRWWGRALSALHEKSDDDQAKKVLEAMQVVADAQKEILTFGKMTSGCVAGSATNVMRTGVQLRNLQKVYLNGSPSLDHIYGPDSGSLSRRLGAVMTRAADAIQSAMGSISASDHLEAVISVEVLTGWRAWGGADYDVPEFRFHSVTPAAAPPTNIPLDNLPSLADWPIKKLYGQRLGHFGAFVSKEGRANDWLWGRLDGANELGKQLLSSAGITGDEAKTLLLDLTNEILRTEGFDEPSCAVDSITKAYMSDNGLLLRELRDDSTTVQKVEDTLWALSHQTGMVGLWLRALLKPDWSADSEAELERLPERRSKESRKLRRRLTFYRRVAGVALFIFGRKLPGELRHTARRHRKTQES